MVLSLNLVLNLGIQAQEENVFLARLGMCWAKTTLALAAAFVALVDCALPVSNGIPSAGCFDGRSPSLGFGHLSQALGAGSIANHWAKSSATCMRANKPTITPGFGPLTSRNNLGRLCCRGEDLFDRSHTSQCHKHEHSSKHSRLKTSKTL